MRHTIVGAKEWQEARKELLAREKELTRARDALAEARRSLPWERVEKRYVFDGPRGKATFGDLFAGRSQLIVYHFMFAPDWSEGCKSCSFWADNFERNVIHVEHRDASLVAISRAPLDKLEAYKKRLGWTFPWYSSFGSDFNFDYGVSFEEGRAEPVYNYRPKTGATPELPGFSVFYRDEHGPIFHTYSTYRRGIEATNAGFGLLDLLPKGRDESAGPMAWLRRRDDYADGT